MENEILTEQDLLCMRGFLHQMCSAEGMDTRVFDKYGVDMVDLGIWKFQVFLLGKYETEKEINFKERLMNGRYQGIKFNEKEADYLVNSSLITPSVMGLGLGIKLGNSIYQSLEPTSNLLEIIASSKEKFEADKKF